MDTFSQEQIRSFIEETIREGEVALAENNYPIGSIVVDGEGEIIAKCHNENSTKDDITAHAEVLCLKELGDSRLSKENGKSYYLFSSLEPCGGCGFFIARTNIKAIFVAAVDPYRSGTSILKESSDFSEIFKDLNFVVCNFPDLAKRSKLLMRDYLVKKGRKTDAKIYE